MTKDYRNEAEMDRSSRMRKKVSAIVARILEARSNAGLTQDELADFAGISVSTIKRYEHGVGELSIQKLFCIASALNLDLDELVSDNKYLLYKYSRLTKEDQDLVCTMIDRCIDARR